MEALDKEAFICASDSACFKGCKEPCTIKYGDKVIYAPALANGDYIDERGINCHFFINERPVSFRDVPICLQRHWRDDDE